MIELINLSKVYPSKSGGFAALGNVNLKIDDGDVFGIIGLSGAGKSTLIHLICDLLPRQVGTIAFDGTDILSMGPAFRQVLGFMPQSQGMCDDMTALPRRATQGFAPFGERSP